MVSTILNAQRLVQLAGFHPKLKNVWYLIAATTFSVCNEPQELQKLYHFAMFNDSHPGESLKSAKMTMDLLQTNAEKLESQVNELYEEPTVSQRIITQKLREALLKSSALAGIPKSINSLQSLKLVTPRELKPNTEDIDANSSRLLVGTLRPTAETVEQTIQHGVHHWNKVYSKVSNKVVNNLNSSYPDLWQFVLCNVYGPLLSFDEILNAQETSLVIISSLVPQDLNLQLWGHLKGALNVGCDQETINAARNLSIVVAKWCEVRWKSDVVKL
ncbi:LANO_0E06216g1_1 [Lachancea nothofagi CBS 11611]|uniref:LANO_0E06216g1_1 n=1 Tax=Lachancea nothofagi CBS 11611 TaxID=1266666 RepID=A0A1G4JTN4_9SACH|nr:LANO_0E06216g1_1 [Lachancea nothofagi CBS 11611]